MFCSNCGKEVDEKAFVCPYCGVKLWNDEASCQGKSKIAAGLLALFLGTLGIHNFYLGYKGKGIAQLILTTIGAFLVIGPIISSIWAFVEMILIFMGNINDSDNRPLI